MALERLLDERQRYGFVPLLGDLVFQDLALMVDRSPEVVHLAADLHLDLVEAPPPVGGLAHAVDTLPADLSSEHAPKARSPEPHQLMADVDATFVQHILNVPQRQGDRTYIITTKQITSGELSNQRNGLGGDGRRGMTPCHHGAPAGPVHFR